MNALERELARFDLEFVLEIVELREAALRRQRNQEIAARIYLESFLAGRDDPTGN